MTGSAHSCDFVSRSGVRCTDPRVSFFLVKQKTWFTVTPSYSVFPYVRCHSHRRAWLHGFEVSEKEYVIFEVMES